MLLCAVGLAVACAAFLAFELRYFHYAERWTHPSRKAITTAEHEDAQTRLPTMRDVAFKTSDGVEIRGWYVPSRNGATVVFGHGLGENRVRFVPDAEFLARHGYGSLLFDWRANGESGGDVATWGDLEQRDLTAAVDFALVQPDVDGARLAAAGFSIGASTVAMVAANDTRIRAVILMAVWTSLEDELDYKFRRYGFLSRWPATEGFRREGVHFGAIRPIDVVGRIAPRPILFIGGSADSDTPPWVIDRVFAAAGPPKSRWTAPGAEHGFFRVVAPAEYERTIVSFLDDAFFPKSRP
jgi:dipeptidyl aminopeptidase/acylaminoacyl peptidase